MTPSQAPPGRESLIQVTLFGGPRVSRAGVGIRLSPYQQALVTLVFGHDEGIVRSRAAWMLWEADDGPKVRQRLRQLLHGIALRTKTPVITSLGDRLQRPGKSVKCDIDLVRGPINLAEAAILLRKRFAPTLVGAIGREYDDWLDTIGLLLVRDLRAHAGLRWDGGSASGDWEAARDGAEALYVLDSRDEKAVIKVVESRARAGKLGSAEAAYASYAEALGPGCEPCSELVRLIGRIRQVSSADPSLAREPVAERLFVGRSDAMGEARKTFGEVRSGRFGFTLVAGESGIGKTRILGELRREALLHDFQCLHAEPVELERRIPLNPLLDALTSIDLMPHLKALGEPWHAVIGSLLPVGTIHGPTGEVPPIQESSLSRRLLDAFFLLFERLASQRPTLLFIDDLQWADATTVAVLQFLQRRWADKPLGVVATIRPEAVQRTDPAASYLTKSDGLLVRKVEVGDLSAEEARLLVTGIAADKVDATTVRRVCVMAGHHPLYLTELTKDLLAGRLRLPELLTDQVSIPISLQQILASRLEHLSAAALRVARILAVGARPMRLYPLAQLAGLALDDCAGCADELKGWRLVELERDTVRIAHELFRSALYRDMGEASRAILHRAIGERLLIDSPDSAGELAIHFARAGEASLAAKHGWVAAAKAADDGAVAEAAYFFELVTENEQDPGARAQATAELARALHLNRQIGRANPLLELAALRLRASGDAARALRMEIRRVGGLAEVGDTPVPELIERLNVLKREAQASKAWEVVALALDAELHLLHRHEDVAGVRALFSEIRTVAAAGSPEARAICMSALALGVLYGDPDEALRAAHEAVRLTVDARTHRFTALNRLLFVLQFRGMLELPSTAATVQEARRLAKRTGDLFAQVSLESNLALGALDAGDLARAEALMDRARRMLGSADMQVNRFNQAYNLGELALAQSDFGRAIDAFGEAEQYINPTTPAYVSDFLNAGIGLCSLESGNLSEARRREEAMSHRASSWRCDPTTILTFRARLLERRNRCGEALAMLAEGAEDLDGRLVLAWLKVRALQVRLLRKGGDEHARILAAEAHERALSLNLTHRAATFAEVLKITG